MDFLQQYVLSLISGSILCGIVLNLIKDGSHRDLIRTLCGMILTLLFLCPVFGIQWELDFGSVQDVLDAGKREVSAGKKMAYEEQVRRITADIEAYILDKADREDVSVTVSVTLGEDLRPVSAVLRGEISSQKKQVLSEIIETELGITKERQIWTG